MVNMSLHNWLHWIRFIRSGALQYELGQRLPWIKQKKKSYCVGKKLHRQNVVGFFLSATRKKEIWCVTVKRRNKYSGEIDVDLWRLLFHRVSVMPMGSTCSFSLCWYCPVHLEAIGLEERPWHLQLGKADPQYEAELWQQIWKPVFTDFILSY